ncbi:G-I-Y Y-I-G endonuclease [Gordonia phage ODay]|nr:G-I-Y Y-I-G endonuclease [Gordonia phage ODay]
MEPIFITHPYARPCFVYRVFAEDGTLLYIGSSFSVQFRINEHAVQRPCWWPLAYRVESERFDDPKEARAAERVAIINEKPIGNVKWTTRAGDSAVHPRLLQYVNPMVAELRQIPLVTRE